MNELKVLTGMLSATTVKDTTRILAIAERLIAIAEKK